MTISSNQHEKNQIYNFTKEYNIVSIISFSIAILSFICLVLGAITLYSYLIKLDKLSLFIELLNDKLLYAISFAILFILLFIFLYSLLPSLILASNKEDNIRKGDKILALSNITISNITVLVILLWYIFLESTDLSNNWEYNHYLINICPFIYFIFLIPYNTWIYNKYSNFQNYSLTGYNIITKIISWLISLSFYISIPIILMNFELRSNELDEINYFNILMIFTLPIISQLMLGYCVLFWKEMIPSYKISLIMTNIFFWLMYIVNISPILMASIGLNEFSNREWCINNNKIEARSVLNYGNNVILLKKETLYKESIIYDKKDIKDVCQDKKHEK